MIQRVAIMGAGSLGTILGAYIAKGGVDVTLVDAYEEHVKVLNEKGAHVVGFTDMVVPVKACTPDKMEGKFDLFIYMAKQTFNDTAIPQMVEHCHENTIICTCQNGLPELAVCEYWPKEKVFGAPVGWGATFKGPGVSECTSVEGERTFHLGSVVGPITPEVLEVQKILELMCPTEVLDNLMGSRWAKVLINACFSGMSTVIDGTFGDVMDDPIAIKCVAHIGRETIQACAASGVKMEPFAGVDFTKVFDWKTDEERVALQEMLKTAFAGHRSLVASMLQDLHKGRKCEIFAINGVVSSTGKKYNIPTPICDQVVEMVSGFENGNGKPGKENLSRFVF